MLLAIDKVCKEEGIKIPYEKCGPEIAPSVTGNAIVQHIAKLRKKMEAEVESNEDEGGDSAKKEAKDDSSNASYTPDTTGVSKKSIGKRGYKRNVKKGKKKEVIEKKAAGNNEKEFIKKDHTEGTAGKMNRQSIAWMPKGGDSETDGDEYVAAGSSFVGRDEDSTEEDVSDAVSASSASEDGQGSKIVILRLPKEKYRLRMQAIQFMEDSSRGTGQETGVANITGSLPTFGLDDAGSGFISNVANPGQQLLMSGSAAVPAQPHQTIGTSGMYDFNPMRFVAQTAGYTPNMMYAPGNDATIHYPYADLFGGPDPGFIDMDMTGYNPFDADFEIASGNHTDTHAAGSRLTSFEGTQAEAMALLPTNPPPGSTTMETVPGNHTNTHAAGPSIASLDGVHDDAMALVPVSTNSLITTAKPPRRHMHRRTLTFAGSERFRTNAHGRLEVTGHATIGGRFLPLNSPPSIRLSGMKEVKYNDRYHVPRRDRANTEGRLRLEDGTTGHGHVGKVSRTPSADNALTNLPQYDGNTDPPRGWVEEEDLA